MKKNIFKKIINLTYLVFILFGFLTPVHFSLAAIVCPSGQTPSADGNSCISSSTYHLLAPLPNPNGGTISDFDPTNVGGNTGGDALTKYLNLMIKLFIGICSVLAVIMIVMGGIEYMTTELISSKEAGKERIRNAILGLLLALSAWTLLNTINPNLLNSSLSSLKSVTVNVQLEPEPGIQGTSTNAGGSVVTSCNPSELTTIPFLGSSVTVNKAIVADLQKVDAAWTSKGGNNFYKVSSVAGYNCRAVTGKPGYWSAHAFGIAVDINPSTNPYTTDTKNQMKTDMPSEFVNLFTSVGWGWGGSWGGLKDPMHFSSDNS